MTTLPIIEIVAYSIIGLAGFLVVGGAVFLAALGAYERIEAWYIERRARKIASRR